MLSAHHIVAIVVATFSILGNIFICLSCHLFKELSKDCLYNLVYWEALSALLYSTGFIFGTPESGSTECFSQALLFQYFGMSSMLAIYLILYHMNKLITRDQTQVAVMKIHIHTYIHTYIHTDRQTDICSHVHMLKHTYMKLSYIRMLIHTYIHTYMCSYNIR